MNRVKQIEYLVCNEFNITLEQLRSRSLNRKVTLSRCILWTIVKRKTNLSTFKSIKEHYGYRTHSNIREGVLRVKDNMDTDYRLKIKYINILKRLG